MESCTICGSDLRIFREGSKRITEPRIIGHETSGKIYFSKSKKLKLVTKYLWEQILRQNKILLLVMN